MLARPDVDAVIIATPDHWHQKIAIDAMNAGKDVYLEKPMIQHAEEGAAIIEAANKTKRIIQIGSQRVSSVIYEKARQLYKSGAIGQLNLVEAYTNRNSAMGAWQYTIPPDASPQNIDWDRFLGHAPKRPFEPIRLFRWRNYQDYGTGVGGDLFVHLFSGIHYVLNSHGPTRILSTGGIRYWNDGRDVPDVMLAIFDYPKTASHPAFNLFLKINFAAGGGEESRFQFVGDEGTITIGNVGAGNGCSIQKTKRPADPGLSIGTFPEGAAEADHRGAPEEVSGGARRDAAVGPRIVRRAARLQRLLRSLRQLLQRRAVAEAGGRGRRLRPARGRPRGAGERQLLRAASRGSGIRRR